MADLMDFAEENCENNFDNDEDDVVDDEDDDDDTGSSQVAPRLVQSPVILNSILKHSNKDNLIQLYTPQQKPDKSKLKVHFGGRSVLQTPVVKHGKENCVDDRTGTPARGVKFRDTPEEISPKVNSKSKDEEKEEEVSLQAPEEEVDSCDSQNPNPCEESAMDISLCDTQFPSSTGDILLEAELLLKSLGEYGSESAGSISPAKQEQPDQSVAASGSTDESARISPDSSGPADVIKKPEETGESKVKEETISAKHEPRVCEKIQPDASVQQGEKEEKLPDEVKKEHVEKLQEEEQVTDGHGEPMDYEEAMDVDEEIVFNIKKPSEEQIDLSSDKKEKDEEEETRSEEKEESEVGQNVYKHHTEPAKGDNATELTKTDEGTCTEKESVVEQEIQEIKEPSALLDGENKEKTEDKLLQKSLNSSSVIKVTDNENLQQTSSKKNSGDESSDDEFMSADEEMDVDEARTPSKPDTQALAHNKAESESPERTPPKVGYSLNFDDLEAMDPFASKKSLMNSPDVSTEANRKKIDAVKSDKKETGVKEKTPAKTEAAEMQHTASASCKEEKHTPEGEANENKRKETGSGKAAASSDQGAEFIEKKTSDKDVDTNESQTNKHTKTELCKNVDDKQSELVQKEKKITEVESKAGDSKEKEKEVKIAVTDVGDSINKHTPSKDQQASTVPAELDVTSPPLPSSKGVYNLDALDLDDVDPFKPRTQMMNSPLSVKGGDNESKQAQPVQQKTPIKDLPNNESEPVCRTEDKILDNQAALRNETNDKIEGKLSSKNENGIQNPQKVEKSSSVKNNADSVEDIADNDIDPFIPKSQIENSPAKNVKTVESTSRNEIDPFKSKTQLMNSPCLKSEKDLQAEKSEADSCEINLKPSETLSCSNNETTEETTVIKGSLNFDEIDPFKPKKQLCNSPDKETQANHLKDLDTLESENFDEIDPFKPKNQIQNSPVKTISNNEVQIEVTDTLSAKECGDVDPFKTKQLLQNSPVSMPASSVNGAQDSDTTLTEDNKELSLREEKQPDVSEQAKDSATTTQVEKGKNKAVAGNPVKGPQKLDTKDPFADLDPFKTKRKIAKSPKTLPVAEEKLPESADPFKTSSKLVSSPASIQGDPFVTKPKITCTPPKEDLFQQKVELPSTPTNSVHKGAPEDFGEIFEVQGVTRRGQAPAQNTLSAFGEVDETQFVSASEVFNDPAAWEMLEKLGGSSTSAADSALSRMSLYVKFDPLVEATNPRRISIRMSQLEKVKEYGLDDTLLLLGTPPKKRRQSMMAQQARHTPSGPRTTETPATLVAAKKLEPVAPTPAAVDLILAYSPSTIEESADPAKNPPVMSLLDTDFDESSKLFQELKYTDADLKKIQQDMELAAQGMLISKDKEWCKKEQEWKKHEALLNQKIQVIKADRDKIAKAFDTVEQVVAEMVAARDAAEKKVKEVTTEKNQALDDIHQLDNSLSLLLQRYEKAKSVIATMQKNEETLKKFASDELEKRKKADEKYHALEKSVKEKLARRDQEMEKLQQQLDSVQSKSDAQTKILTMKIENLETSLQRKTEENKQLTEICDNLLAKVDG